MAAIPDYTSLPQAQPQPSGGIAHYEPPNWRQVGMVGDAIQQAGGKIEQAGEIMAQANQRQDELVAQSAANTLSTSRAQLQYDPTIGFINAKEGNAVGQKFTQDYLQRFDTAADNIRGNLQGANQQRIFDQHMQVQRDAFTASLLQHQSQETDKFNDSTQTDTIKNAIDESARNAWDPVVASVNRMQIVDTATKLAQRKGFSPESTQQFVQKFTDAADSARVISVAQGIPGVVQADPYGAEKLFDSLQNGMAGETRIKLGAQVFQEVKGVQQRDIAHAIVSGQPVTNPKDLQPGAEGVPLAGVVTPAIIKATENSPNGAVSPKGAASAMQVIPTTAANPGFGVAPAKVGPDGKPLPGELERVGTEFLGAMTARYQDPALVLASYNAGPGQVDKWIQKYGDPRTGMVSDADWVSKIPFNETKDYVTRGLAKVQPTANQIKAENLPGMLDRARTVSTNLYPNDPAFADGVVARVANYANQALAGKVAQQQAAGDTLTQSLLGPNGDGKNAPTSIDQALSDPATKAAFDQATPQAKEAYLTRLATGDKQWTNDSMGTYYTLLGTATNDPENFGKVDLMQYYGKIPDAHLQQLMAVQKSVNQKDIAQQNRDLNWNRAMGDVRQMIAPIVDKKLVGEKRSNDLMDQFSGRFREALQQYHDQNNNKWPDTPTTQKIAGGLIAQGSIQGSGWLSDTKERFFQAQSEGTASKFYVPLPSKRSGDWTQLQNDFKARFGRAPTSDTELQNELTKHVLATGQTPPWVAK